MCEHAFMQDTDRMGNKMSELQVCRDPWPGPGSEKDQTLLKEKKKGIA